MTMDRRSFLIRTAAATAAFATMQAKYAQAFAEAVKVSAEELAKDPRRPQFHLLPARNWMNDPNGPIYWKGHYHMFYQYNPNAAVWGDMHWNHAVSEDMVHWKHLGVALAPTPDGPDRDGCFSGTAVVNHGVVTLIYTGVASAPLEQATIRDGVHSMRETQLYATTTDPMLQTWTKLPAPVIPLPPEGMRVSGFRDPAPWRVKDTWYMAVGSGFEKKGGAVLLYESKNLQHWEYLHLLTSGEGATTSAANPVDSGDMWECPDFFALGKKHVLIYSTQGKVFWQSGELDEKELVFHSEKSGLLDYGSFYAPKTQLDKGGNRILWGWIPETRPEAEFSASGWAGLMSLPRVLTLGKDDRLRFGIACAVDGLRQQEQRVAITSDEAGNKQKIAGLRVKEACAELLCQVEPGSEPFTLDLGDAAGDGKESFLAIRYSKANPDEVVVDLKRMPVTRSGKEPLEFHLYVDGSVIELFVNGQVTYTKRFYFAGATAPELAVSITGETKGMHRLSLWQLSPISANRLTT